ATVHRISRRASVARQQAMKSYGEEFLDATQGLPTLAAFGQARAYGRMLAEKARTLSQSTLRVLGVNILTRGVTDLGMAAGSALDDTGQQAGIAFEQVRFAYPGARSRGTALEEVTFSVAPGERVGIVGASGAGKSSIVRLILRSYDPASGSVRIGGQDLRDA